MKDKLLDWKPFGVSMTYSEYNSLLTGYVQKKMSEYLNTKEVYYDAYTIRTKN